LTRRRNFAKTQRRFNGSESGGGLFPRWFFVSSGPAIPEKQLSGEKKGITMTRLTIFKTAAAWPLPKVFLLIPLVLAWFGLSPVLSGVTPTPDGGYFGANTAEGGPGALFSLTTGTNNTALGSQALFSVRTGKQNTATGSQALKNNRADNNTADGFQALVRNTTGFDNCAIGWRALSQNTAGTENTAVGSQALGNTTIGQGNIAIGFNALVSNTLFSANTAVGTDALPRASGTNNTALGSQAGLNNAGGDNNIYIGNQGPTSPSAEDNSIHIGDVQTATFIAGIYGEAPIAPTLAVVVDQSGKLSTAPSSVRFKNEIKAMDSASEAILALKPVTFHYKSDKTNRPEFGLIAEDVAEVDPDLVVRDDKGEIYTVRYEAVNAMLLNEFLKEHRTVQEQKATIAELKQNFGQQQKQIAALAAGLQKVSAQIQLSKAASQTALNNQ
jgi:hypothetical protein